jgi:peptidoglycan/LPS O-acetylase OafA/YrhL
LSKIDTITYRRDIDGLRAVAAVLCVFIYHGFPTYLPGGYIGVDIFFVISEILITGIILKGCELENFKIINFYFRRIKRIFPVLRLVLAVCLLFGWFALSKQELQQLGKPTFVGALFFSNIVLL